MDDIAIANSKGQPYKPSWIDRFTNWVEKLPIRASAFYVGLGFVLIIIQAVFLWLEGGLHAELLLPIIVFNGFAVPFLLILINFLDNQAVTALDSMKTALDITESNLNKYRFQLSNMPSGPMLISGLIMTVTAILIERFSITPVRYAALEQLPVFAIVYHLIDKGLAFLFGVFIFHTIRQLRLVNTINMKHIRVNLFDLGSLRAFSKLTSSTAVGLVIGIYGWMLINPDLLTNQLFFGFAALITILAAAVFIWPLLGVHRLMETEKERMLHNIDLRFESVFLKFDQHFLDDNYSTIEKLNLIISSLEIQHKRIKAIPTWPWKPETARLVLSAVAIPLILTILRFLIEQAFFS
ncbi:MAG: hypothetical protein JSV69_03220 [Chloroflexota bacterium]|nr:MAG: hypothetical protein JSV69_03220 [Chloroflexota bacterium]